MPNFLQDKTFLLKVNQYKVKEYQAAILVLDFETEAPIARLEGKVVSGNMSIAANSPVRRTCSLSLVFDDQTKKITDINNLIAVDKKISLSIGFNNPFYHLPQYRDYGEMLWFKQGIFFITKASSSISATSTSVSVELQDKMCQLNGTVGGTLPATVSFHDKIILEDNGDMTTEYPLIKEIIREAVHHFGGEHFSRISIEDVPDVGRTIVRYNGNTPIHFAMAKSKNSGVPFVISANASPDYDKTYFKGDNVGYRELPLTYPGELILKGGSTVTQLLDEIVKTLGNYEYFYDQEGIFHFRRIPNFQMTGQAPLNFNQTTIQTQKVIDPDGKVVEEKKMVEIDKQLQNLYLPRYSDIMFLNEFADASLVTSVSFSPNYNNLKNDFICWGTKNSDSGEESMVRYHLAVDVRPKDIRRPDPSKYDKVTQKEQYDAEYQYELLIGSAYSLCHKEIREVRNKETKKIIRYEVTGVFLNPLIEEWGDVVAPCLDTTFPNNEDAWFNWREELYRKALLAYGSSTEGSYYDEELMAEWRQIFDPTSSVENKGLASFEQGWKEHYEARGENVPWTGYIIDTVVAPEKLRYWLDIIDTSSFIGQYGVNRIGRRAKVTENSKINMVFETEIPDIVFIENTGDLLQMQDNVKYYTSIGQHYTFLNKEQVGYFTDRNSFGTCYEEVRSMLYNYLIYNASVSLTSIPIFYLEPNCVIRLNFPDLGIVGDYVIKNISWAIGNGGTMSLSLNESITVV